MGAADQRFDGFLRHFHHVGDFPIAHALESSEQDGLSLPCGESLNRVADDGLLFDFRDFLGGSRAASGHDTLLKADLRRVGISQRDGVKEGFWAPTLRTKRVESHIVRDAEKPDGERSLLPIGRAVLEHAHKNLLREILGERGVADEALQIGADFPLISRRKLLERERVVGLNRQHQFRVLVDRRTFVARFRLNLRGIHIVADWNGARHITINAAPLKKFLIFAL